MTDNNQLHQEFLNDFTELLQRYNADFECLDCTPEIYFQYISNEDGDIIREHSTFNLPRHINPN